MCGQPEPDPAADTQRLGAVDTIDKPAAVALERHQMDGPPSLILLDLKMPKVTGLEVLQQIKSDPALESIPVMVVTSAQDKAELQACFDLGINSWFRKPPEFAEFGKAVKEILEADDPTESQR